MGLFGKKKTVPCPVCGREMDAGLFGDSKAVADGTICGNCERMLRGKFDIQHYLEKGFFQSEAEAKEKMYDPLRHMTIEQIKSLVDEANANRDRLLASLGGNYSSVLTTETVFQIAPKPLDVGLKRAGELKNKLVVRGMVQAGSFAKGDNAFILHAGCETPVAILDVLPCDGVTEFDTALKANTGKKEASEDINAWLILSAEAGVVEGDVIAKK